MCVVTGHNIDIAIQKNEIMNSRLAIVVEISFKEWIHLPLAMYIVLICLIVVV
jgi:hypothetical protein